MPDARWEQIKAIFAKALAVEGPARRELLDRECADNAELRREVESLLAAQSHPAIDTGAALDAVAAINAAGPSPSASAKSTVSAPITEKPGEHIGPYKLLQQIGEGGFGVVFMAEQERPVRRRVALKIIKLGMDTRQVIARFEAERQALALMDHPHIARVLDAGATDTGRPYFVMEYVKGDPITAFADAHKLSVKARLDLFTQVCQAVQHAHTKGVIHRDLKPGNVVTFMSDGRPFAKVIDFGIAKATGQSLTDKTLFTEHHQLIGTPVYMSPEQAEGSPDIDTRTDVYALGVMLYELLSGTTPFDAQRLRSAALGEMQRILKEEDPPPPSLRLSRNLASLAVTAASRQVEPAKLGTMIKGELDWIVMKALDKDRARRYETANALSADVFRYLSGEPVVAAPPSAGYRVKKFVRRHRGPVIAGSAIGGAILLGIGGTTWQWREVRRANTELREIVEFGECEMSSVFLASLGDNKDAIGMQMRISNDDGRALGSLQINRLPDGKDVKIRSIDPEGHKGGGKVLFAMLGDSALRAIQESNQRAAELDAAIAELREQVDAARDILGKVVAKHSPHVPQGGCETEIKSDDGKTIGYVRVDMKDETGQPLAEPRVTVFGPGEVFDDARPEPGGLETIRMLGQFASDIANDLDSEVKRARLAQADLYCARYELGDMGAGGTDEARAQLQDAINIYEKHLGLANLKTVKAICELGDNQTGMDADLPYYEEAANRLEASGAQPNGELVQLYMIMPLRYGSKLDLPTEKKWLNRIAAALPSLVRNEGPLYIPDDDFGHTLGLPATEVTEANFTQSVVAIKSLTLPSLLETTAWNWTYDYPWSWADPVCLADDPGRLNWRTTYATPYWRRIANMALGMLKEAPDDPHALISLAMAQRVLGDPAALDTARKAQAARAKAGMPEEPTDLAVACMALAQLGRADEAKAGLERLQETCAAYEGSKHIADSRLSAIEDVLNPELSPDRQLAEETKRRKLAEADAAVAEFQSRELQPVGMRERVEEALAARTDYLGRSHLKTAQARVALSGFQDERHRALAYAELRIRERDFEGALGWLTSKEIESDVRAITLAAIAHLGIGTADHFVAARAALARASVLMADPANTETWAKDSDAKALLVEAEALIESPLTTQSAPTQPVPP